jgi:hypothetical protein
MSSKQRLTVEPAGNSEADWSSGVRSSTGLPDFVEGEFTHMIELGQEPEEAEDDPTDGEEPLDEDDPEDGGAERPLEAGSEANEYSDFSEKDRVAVLDAHMTALLEVGGKDRESPTDGISALFSRFAELWSGS